MTDGFQQTSRLPQAASGAGDLDFDSNPAFSVLFSWSFPCSSTNNPPNSLPSNLEEKNKPWVVRWPECRDCTDQRAKSALLSESTRSHPSCGTERAAAGDAHRAWG